MLQCCMILKALRSMHLQTVHAERNPCEYLENPLENPCEYTTFNAFPHRACSAEPL